ncbi:MAG: DUF86 domain-containing protein [Vicinamibacteria bacterium]|nr:DUF86 domain-containing protein [Vicinamibacteria bacterium]
MDPELLKERGVVIEAHLARIRETLPEDPVTFTLGTDTVDVVSLHLLFAIQVVLDLSIFACIHFGLQAPASYDDAVGRLAHAGRITDSLADRLEKAATFRDAFVHAFDQIDAASIYRAARVLPDDLRMFMADLGRQLGE